MSGIELPKVFKDGPLAETVEFYANYAEGMFNNGSFYPVEPTEGSDVSVVVNGRKNGICEIDKMVTDGEQTKVIASMYDYITEAERLPREDSNGTKVSFTPYFASDLDEQPVTAEVLAVDVDNFEETLKFILASIASTAYMAGRKDAVEDLRGSNSRRFIRTRHLPQVIDLATRPQDGDYAMFTQSPAELIAALRKIADDVIGSDVVVEPLPIRNYQPEITLLDGRVVKVGEVIFVDETVSEEK